ncbi:hypothetical protein Tco_1314295 [Tanacetum coccineum]
MILTLIPNELLTDEIRATKEYKAYEEKFVRKEKKDNDNDDDFNDDHTDHTLDKTQEMGSLETRNQKKVYRALLINLHGFKVSSYGYDMDNIDVIIFCYYEWSYYDSREVVQTAVEQAVGPTVGDSENATTRLAEVQFGTSVVWQERQYEDSVAVRMVSVHVCTRYTVTDLGGRWEPISKGWTRQATGVSQYDGTVAVIRD